MTTPEIVIDTAGRVDRVVPMKNTDGLQVRRAHSYYSDGPSRRQATAGQKSARLYKIVTVSPDSAETADEAVHVAARIASTMITRTHVRDGVVVVKSEATEHALKGQIPWAGWVVKLLLDVEDVASNVRNDRTGRPEGWK